MHAVVCAKMEDGHRITEVLLKKALSSDFSVSSGQIKILDFKVSKGAKDNDNYACEIKSVSVRDGNR
jgi:hypothetical protein